MTLDSKWADLSMTYGPRIHGYPEEDLRPPGVTGGRAGKNRGYFPVLLGQQFLQGKYVILRKLGFGDYSTVWLARDRSQNRFVALKILTAAATAELERGETVEIAVLDKIRLSPAAPTHPGRRHMLDYFETLTLESPHGAHRCIVTHLRENLSLARLRENLSLAHLRGEKYSGQNGWTMPMGLVRSVVRQVVFGLDYLHTECGIIHTDLSMTTYVPPSQHRARRLHRARRRAFANVRVSDRHPGTTARRGPARRLASVVTRRRAHRQGRR